MLRFLKYTPILFCLLVSKSIYAENIDTEVKLMTLFHQYQLAVMYSDYPKIKQLTTEEYFNKK